MTRVAAIARPIPILIRVYPPTARVDRKMTEARVQSKLALCEAAEQARSRLRRITDYFQPEFAVRFYDRVPVKHEFKFIPIWSDW